MKKGRNLLNRLEYKFGKYAISNLMLIVVGAMGIVFIMDLLISAAMGISISSQLSFDRGAIFQGQIWRILTFAFLPPNSSLIFILFSLYFYYIIGSALEREWGAFRFNLFYLCGILCTIAAGFITGSATNYFLNMSLFFAFALLYPNFEILLFFFIPLKIKYLAYLDAAYFLYLFIISGISGKLAIAVSLLNLLLFFWSDLRDELSRLWTNFRFRMRRK